MSCAFRLIVLANLFFWKQVLHEEQDAHVSMVRSLGEQVCYSLVSFLHKVVDYDKYGLPTIKVVHVWQSLVKNYSWISTKQLLVFAVTVHYLAGRWF